MKKIVFFSAMLLAVFMAGCNSCGNKDKVDDRTVEEVIKDSKPVTEMQLSGADTAAVLKEVNEFTAHLKQSDVDAALRMVKYLDKDSIKPVPKYLEKKERMVLGTVTGASRYDIENITLLKEKDSEVRVMVTLLDLPKGDTRPNQVGMIIKPVRRNGVWYLTLADTGSETNRSEILH